MVISVNVLITGATSGIGYSLAIKLIEKGHFVYMCTHHKEEINSVLERLKVLNYDKKAVVMRLDITNKKDIEKINKYDIDCLVNQAGIGVGGSLLDLSIEDVKSNFEVNFFGTLALTKEYIKSRGNKNGKVLVTSSIAGIMPISFLGAYCSSKAALISMFSCLRKEVRDAGFNIQIKLIEPGAYKTGFNQLMILNKEKNEYIFSDKYMKKVINRQLKEFNLIEKKSLDSVVDKMVSAVLSNSDKFVYRTPFIQSICARIYMLLFM